MASPIEVPFAAGDSGTIGITLNFQYYFDASHASDNVVLLSSNSKGFSPALTRIVIAKGGQSSTYTAVEPGGICPITTSYENGQAGDAVTRPIRISKDGQRFPVKLPTGLPTGFSPTYFAALLFIAGGVFVGWWLTRGFQD